jgi:hypothetical protein
MPSPIDQFTKLDVLHPTAIAFLDESGSMPRDRIFAVGCLKLSQPSVLLRQIRKLRDQRHFYEELHFTRLTRSSLSLYFDVLRLIASAEAQFSCFVADRKMADPVARFGGSFRAYEKLAIQLLIGSTRPGELVTVLADEYSVPDDSTFEETVKSEVNSRLGRLAVTTVCRLDSRSIDGLQLADILTSAVAFEFRQSIGLAGRRSPKAQLAKRIREEFGFTSFLAGGRTVRQQVSTNVAIYRQGSR